MTRNRRPGLAGSFAEKLRELEEVKEIRIALPLQEQDERAAERRRCKPPSPAGILPLTNLAKEQQRLETLKVRTELLKRVSKLCDHVLN